MKNFHKNLKASWLHTATLLIALLLCGVTHSTQAQDDLYFSPKKQRELDRQKAAQRAYNDSIRAAQAPLKVAEATDYTETWRDFDSVDSRGYRGIYDLSQRQETPQEEERESYADRLRYDDPTYVVLIRDTYNPWWGWGGWGYPSWGWSSYNRWGWGVGWSYPYYPWGYPYYAWGSPYYGWGYPHYGWGWSWGYHSHRYPTASSGYSRPAGQHRGGIAGTTSGTGYTNNRSSSNQSTLNAPLRNIRSALQSGSSSGTVNVGSVRTSGRSAPNNSTSNTMNINNQNSSQDQSSPSYNTNTNSNSSSSSSFGSSSNSTRGSGSSSSSSYGSSSVRSGSGSSSYGSSGSRKGSGR